MLNKKEFQVILDHSSAISFSLALTERTQTGLESMLFIELQTQLDCRGSTYFAHICTYFASIWFWKQSLPLYQFVVQWFWSLGAIAPIHQSFNADFNEGSLSLK